MPKQALTLLVLASSLALLSMAARADGGAVRVHNKSSATVTVNSESGYCCTADSGDTCSCVLTVGKHTLKAQWHDDDYTQVFNVDVPADGYDLNLSDNNP